VGAEFFHVERRTDGRTDMAKLMVTFLNFANASTNQLVQGSNLNLILTVFEGLKTTSNHYVICRCIKALVLDQENIMKAG
jgi:hypothetical protein